jgi:predicted lipoprotein with Yx(FWY)xxD motif
VRGTRSSRLVGGAVLLAAAAAVTMAVLASAAMAARSGSHAAGAARATAVTARSSRYGRILFDGNGRALYLFDRDRAGRSSCSGACAKAWPPFLTKSAPKAGIGLRAGLLGTTRRSDGKLQVTYAGHPLYYYSGDVRPGQIKCQGVSNFGGLWLVVSPAGKAVH